jgi:hypothetical protein
MELGVSAYDCGIQVYTEMTITGLVFCKNPAKMSDSNWNDVYKLEARWMVGRHLTVIGKSNILRAQIQPLVSFVGVIIDMPDSIDKKLRTICMKFTWGGLDKEKRC